MKVSELIERLSKENPNAEVMVTMIDSYTDTCHWTVDSVDYLLRGNLSNYRALDEQGQLIQEFIAVCPYPVDLYKKFSGDTEGINIIKE